MGRQSKRPALAPTPLRPETSWIEPAGFADAVRELVEGGGRHVMLVGFDGAVTGVPGTLAVEEILELPDAGLARVATRVPTEDPRYPSLTPILPAAAWDEREARDLLGVVPVGHPDPRPLVLHEGSAGLGYPLRRGEVAGRVAPESPVAPVAPDAPDAPPASPDADAPRPFKPLVARGEGVYQLPVGPIHAGIIEPGHFRFSAVGESVLYLDARLFYTHRGIEKLVEGRGFAEALPVVERACGVCTVTHALAYSRAVEELTGTEVPARAQWGRVLLAELERIYNHVGDLGNICAGVGFHYGISQLGWQKERLLRLNEALTGHRYLTGAIVPGGLRVDLPAERVAEVASAIEAIGYDVSRAIRHLVRSESLMNRLHGAGTVSRETAERLGALGVAARASGLGRDLRRDHPYESYRELAVPPIVAHSGDVAARFHVRAQELVASVGLVREAAARIPAGEHRVPLAADPRPGDSAVVGVEGPRGASWLYLIAGRDPRGRATVERLHLRTGSFTNWPVVATAAAGNLVPDFPLINKSFELCYACTDR